ncbi:MAG: pantoate--beta-alanine ligase [Thermodesulfovibrionales bacterium]|nr:pantoate--beta-alanine ligase [Thermodesulfovibrionales bacterium]
MHETSKRYIQQRKSIGFVPTMGALHKGHLSLFRRARDENDIVVASIFVNPIQFGPNEDYDRYPRDIEGDIAKLERESVDVLFLPDVKSIYPATFKTFVYVTDLSDKLCGAFRPNHFRGVTTVVNKLFNVVKPHKAYFGQKDYQQYLIIKRMVEDLNIDIEIILCPTIREEDGLAMSSRNSYLSSEERIAAKIIYKTLLEATNLIRSNLQPSDIKQRMLQMLLEENHVKEVQYAGIYDPESLDELDEIKRQCLVAIAIKIGETRLIDNFLVDV